MSLDTKKAYSAIISEALSLLADFGTGIDFETTRYSPDVTAEDIENEEEKDQHILLSE